jgi:uncharacterized membrane protein YgcG
MRRWQGPEIIVALLLVVASVLSASSAARAAAAEGWTITTFHAAILVQADGQLDVTETILADFGGLSRHGIVRDIPVIYDYDQTRNRVYNLTIQGVTNQKGEPIPFDTQRAGSFLSVQIGDPNVEVSGSQSYVVHYTVAGALNGFADHDELNWNATGTWPVPIERATVAVTLPGPGMQRITCFEGTLGSTEACASDSNDRGASFGTSRSLADQEQLTVVVGFARGLVPNPTPSLEPKPRPYEEYFQRTPAALAGAAFVALVTLGLIVRSWWRFGRDRRYRTLYYLTDDPSEETRPLLASDPVVIEYQPPEKLRPAEMGLLLDERADPLDATATIVDLAARGYLTIREVDSGNIVGRLIGQKDWQIEKTEKQPSDLVAYESALYQGLFARGSPIRLSALKNHFYTSLHDAERKLYQDGTQQKWFASRPDRARLTWFLGGLGVLVLGGLGAAALGWFFGAGFVGLPLVGGGLLLMILSPWMSRRTAWGRELFRRTLGFRQYVATAETSRQRYNEQQGIFAAYLPYAIVFHCVDKWARAFSDAERQASTQSWYVGSQGFTAAAFSQSLQGFSSGLTATIVSTPGGSGASGFSGGGAGFGGGGGGGHSW